MKNINQYKGIINTFANTSNFFKDYTYMPRSLVYKITLDEENKQLETGLLLSNTNETKFLKIRMPSSAYLHLMSYSNPALPPVPTHTGLINIITNFFNIDVLCAFMKDFNGIGDCTISLVMTSDKKVLCVDAYVYDIIALSMVKKFPMFIRKSIYDEYGMEKDELKGYS